jgi:hypothetical protein
VITVARNTHWVESRKSDFFSQLRTLCGEGTYELELQIGEGPWSRGFNAESSGGYDYIVRLRDSVVVCGASFCIQGSLIDVFLSCQSVLYIHQVAKIGQLTGNPDV